MVEDAIPILATSTGRYDFFGGQQILLAEVAGRGMCKQC